MRPSPNTLSLLRKYESQNIFYAEADRSWPIVWDRAKGMHVWDERGRKYLDLTAAFGVAAAGHANPRVVRAGQKQMAHLLHAMGDVHPHAGKAKLARALSELTFERWSGRAPKSMPSPLRRGGEGTAGPFPAREQGATGTTSRLTGKTIFCNSGFEAVEAALKTALLATGRKGIIAFAGGYHGLGYGALNVTHRSEFRSPFAAQLGAFGQFLPFPEATVDGPDQLKRLEGDLQRAFRKHKIGAVLVEPIQGRAGIRLPPPGFLPLLRRLCDEHAALLIVDEVFTGFGRTGRWFACEHSNTMPDLICLGKALTGGFPLSACVGESTLMDRAWPKSTGEALHTSTFLGHPVGCAMALAQIHEIRSRHLVERSADLGKQLLLQLGKVAELRRELIRHTRGSGLMVGLEWRLRDRPSRPLPVMRLVKQLLRQGFIFLPEGAHGEVLSFTPPLIISPSQIESAVRAVASALQDNKAFP